MRVTPRAVEGRHERPVEEDEVGHRMPIYAANYEACVFTAGGGGPDAPLERRERVARAPRLPGCGGLAGTAREAVRQARRSSRRGTRSQGRRSCPRR